MAITAPRGKQQVVQARSFFFFFFFFISKYNERLQPHHHHNHFTVICHEVFLKRLERPRRSGDKIYGRHRGEEKNTLGEMRAAAAVAATTDDKQIKSDLSTVNSLFFFSVWSGHRAERATSALNMWSLNMKQVKGAGRGAGKPRRSNC